jgi:hypothetical protein
MTTEEIHEHKALAAVDAGILRTEKPLVLYLVRHNAFVSPRKELCAKTLLRWLCPEPLPKLIWYDEGTARDLKMAEDFGWEHPMEHVFTKGRVFGFYRRPKNEIWLDRCQSDSELVKTICHEVRHCDEWRWRMQANHVTSRRDVEAHEEAICKAFGERAASKLSCGGLCFVAREHLTSRPYTILQRCSGDKVSEPHHQY